MAIREIYCPAHFGNSYEVMSPGEMAAYLGEMKHWGFNRYSDWITATDVTSPFRTGGLWTLGQALWERKVAALRAAQERGLGVGVMVTPNHVYLDQVRPEIEAVRGPRISGQLVCPSTAGGQEIILRNAEDAFRELAAAGVRLSVMTASPYDYGGCDCERCRPWMVTFGRLVREVHQIAERYHPGIEPWFCCWWWTREEHEQIAAWAEAEAPGWLRGKTLHIDYDQTRVMDVAVPRGCRRLAFVHVGYGETRKNGDIYGKFGPVVAPRRIGETVRNLAAQGVEGFSAYSEGVFDDVNKALLAGLSSGQFTDGREVLAAYGRRYLSEAWSGWIGQWGDRSAVDVGRAGREVEALAGARWRAAQWRAKVELERLDRAISASTDWTPERLALVERFWAEWDRLNREAYGLGPVRGILARRFAPPKWYDGWHAASGGTAATRGFHPGAE